MPHVSVIFRPPCSKSFDDIARLALEAARGGAGVPRLVGVEGADNLAAWVMRDTLWKR